MPPHERDAEERFLCNPAELDWKMRGQGEDVVQSAVICHQDLRTAAINILKSLNLNTSAAQIQVVFGPSPHAEMLQRSLPGYKAA
jgi:hypothetical protein